MAPIRAQPSPRFNAAFPHLCLTPALFVHTCPSLRARGVSNASAAAISPQVVREAMRKRASHWGAARQEDAHEFFTALLSGLADEVQQAQVGAEISVLCQG